MKSLFEADPTTPTAATISECGTYRYDLQRWWDDSLRACVFVMLNPSTADASRDDPTIKRCVGFAKAWGFGGLAVVNLFAFRATSPDDMKAAADPVGPDNDRHIRRWAEQAGGVVAAWGTHGVHRGRDREVRALLGRVGVSVSHLGLTNGGHPKHPLYLPAASALTAWPAED